MLFAPLFLQAAGAAFLFFWGFDTARDNNFGSAVGRWLGYKSAARPATTRPLQESVTTSVASTSSFPSPPSHPTQVISDHSSVFIKPKSPTISIPEPPGRITAAHSAITVDICLPPPTLELYCNLSEDISLFSNDSDAPEASPAPVVGGTTSSQDSSLGHSVGLLPTEEKDANQMQIRNIDSEAAVKRGSFEAGPKSSQDAAHCSDIRSARFYWLDILVQSS